LVSGNREERNTRKGRGKPLHESVAESTIKGEDAASPRSLPESYLRIK